MSYTVKELFYTLQGEGAQSGTPAVFCRFTGCNLWSGREEDRATAKCAFCDTDFVGGERYRTADILAAAARHLSRSCRWVVCTGGEPLLQLDAALIRAFHLYGFKVAIETNGTIAAPLELDWICVSPKAGQPLLQTSGDELKVVFPQEGLDMHALRTLNFHHHFVQPMDGLLKQENTKRAIEYCKAHGWRLSLQTHKLVGIP